MTKLMHSPAELSENYEILTSFKRIGSITVAVLYIHVKHQEV